MSCFAKYLFQGEDGPWAGASVSYWHFSNCFIFLRKYVFTFCVNGLVKSSWNVEPVLWKNDKIILIYCLLILSRKWLRLSAWYSIDTTVEPQWLKHLWDHGNLACLGGSVGCAVRLETRRSRVRPRRGRQHSFVGIDCEIFSTVILSLPLIQEGQLSVSGERMCTILVNRLED